MRRIPVESTRGLRHAVLRPHDTLAAVAESEPAGAAAYGAFEGDGLIAVGLVGREWREGEGGLDVSWRIRGMATVPEARGRGAGGAVLAALLEHARAQGGGPIWCHARVPARRLYERQGFRAVSAVFELPRIGPHVTMELELPAGPPSRRASLG